jgi:hypothetical protein
MRLSQSFAPHIASGCREKGATEGQRVYANGQRRDMIARARQLLDAATTEAAATERTDNNDEAGETAATPTQRCPCCDGRMIVVETFAADTAPRHRPSARIAAIRIDTS